MQMIKNEISISDQSNPQPPVLLAMRVLVETVLLLAENKERGEEAVPEKQRQGCGGERRDSKCRDFLLLK